MEASLRQLRIRFTASMGLLSGILLLLLCGILCTAIFLSSELTSGTVLETMLDRPSDEITDDMGRPCFLIFTTPEGKIGVVPAYEDRLTAYGENRDAIMHAATVKRDGKFKCNGFYFRVQSQSTPDGTVIYAVIVMPMSMPIVGYVMLTAFLGCWNDFMTPLLYINEPAMYNLSLGLYYRYVNNAGGIPPANVQMAAATVMLIPCAVLFFFFQKVLINGVSVGAVKG